MSFSPFHMQTFRPIGVIVRKAIPALLLVTIGCVAPQLSPEEMKSVLLLKVFESEKALEGKKYAVLGEVKGWNGSKVLYYPLLPMKTPPTGPALDEAKAAAVKLGANAVIIKEIKEIGATATSWKDLECTLIAIKVDGYPKERRSVGAATE